MKAVIFAVALLAGSYSFAGSRCVEGEYGKFFVADSRVGGESGGYEVTRVCRNGRFYAVKAQPAARGCIEGETASFFVSDSRAGGETGGYEMTRVCRNGSFY